ncbi:hypothetical protein YTPLAS21_19960 [Candidatus Nitrosocosmicus sp.]|nr:hypothetical protein YTPLAS21_19960 [Candidatus Nitrosocosmicus sp.]
MTSERIELLSPAEEEEDDDDEILNSFIHSFIYDISSVIIVQISIAGH